MRLGIFAKTFQRRTVAETLDAVSEHGLDCVQFNFSIAGIETLPDQVDTDIAEQVRQQAARSGVELAAVSGTFNLIDPNLERRREGLRRLRALAETSVLARIPVITLCTGTNDPENMWRRHPGNDAEASWRELVESMRIAAAIAEETGVVMAFEPEAANVVNSAVRADRLLNEVDSAHLAIVFDAANLVARADLGRMEEILDEALSLLGPSIVIAHAKDIAADEQQEFSPAGHGLLDFAMYTRLLERSKFDGPLILHGLAENQVDGCVATLRTALELARRPRA